MIKRLPVIAYGALLFLIFSLPCCLSNSYAQLSENLELNLDLSSPTVSLPNIYKPSIDLSGRGKHSDKTLPQTLASADVINTWQADLGLRNFRFIWYP